MVWRAAPRQTMLPPSPIQSWRMSDISSIVQAQRAFFDSGATRPVAFRREQLRRLRDALKTHEAALAEALRIDLGKSNIDSFSTETGQVLVEVNHALRHVAGWARPRRVWPSSAQMPGAAFVHPEPRGISLILAPWNYPVQMILSPLVAALAAGNTAVLKPSELAPAASAALAKLVADVFDPRVAVVVEGDARVAQALLEQPIDFIFFTGGTGIGRKVAEAAARRLIPCVLELGGKSPVIVAADADIDGTARRVAWGKFINAGQTCIAPDYALVERSVMPAFIEGLKRYIIAFYGEDPRRSPDYGRIINDRHLSRLSGYLSDGRVVHGGQVDPAGRYLAPTLIEAAPLDSAVMREEIFGPILPIVPVDDIDEAIRFVNARPKPLALYVFSRSRAQQERVLGGTQSGGACVNDTLVQISSPHLPFGGVGPSGYGSYHGRYGFDAFSHQRSVVRRGFGFDIPIRFAPMRDGYLRILRWALR